MTKSFTSASGHITVPMSRPSRTAPAGSAAKARWAARRAALTAGWLATFEAARPAALERMRASSMAEIEGVRSSGRLHGGSDGRAPRAVRLAA